MGSQVTFRYSGHMLVYRSSSGPPPDYTASCICSYSSGKLHTCQGSMYSLIRAAYEQINLTLLVSFHLVTGGRRYQRWSLPLRPSRAETSPQRWGWDHKVALAYYTFNSQDTNTFLCGCPPSKRAVVTEIKKQQPRWEGQRKAREDSLEQFWIQVLQSLWTHDLCDRHHQAESRRWWGSKHHNTMFVIRPIN